MSSTLRIEAKIPLSDRPNNVAITPDGTKVYVAITGDSYVDVLSFSAYNFGDCFAGSDWVSPSWVVDGPINELTAINSTKPIVIDLMQSDVITQEHSILRPCSRKSTSKPY